MTVSENSRLAYQRLFNTKKLDTLRFRTYTAIVKDPGSTDIDIAQALGEPINCITPRVSELEAVGLVRREQGKNKNGNTARKVYPTFPAGARDGD